MPVPHRTAPAVALLLLLLISGCQSDGHPTAAAMKPATGHQVIDRLDHRALEWRQHIDAVRASASAAAGKVVDGGSVYYGGPQKSFAIEACGRSGGLFLAKGYQPKVELTAKDTILVAVVPGNSGDELQSLLDHAGAAGATVVLLGEASSASPATRPAAAKQPVIQRLPGTPFDAPPGGASTLSIDSLSNVIGMWTWNAEFVAACVRLGKMPRIYESHLMPGGRDRDTPYLRQAFHATSPIKPQDASDLGLKYLDALHAGLTCLRDGNREAFAKGAELIKASHAAGGSIRMSALGHMFPSEVQVPQNPSWMTVADPKDTYGPNDLAVVLWYQCFPSEILPKLTSGGAAVVTSPHLPPLEYLGDPKHVYINSCWDVHDAVVEIRGYDVKAFPISGLIQGAVYWQLVELATQ